MMKRTICAFTGGIIVLLFLVTGTASAQNVSDLKFNEILVHNDSLNVDAFGMHSSWIEIFNSGYNTVDIGGCYLTNDKSNPTKYWIPTGDPSTKIPARCYLLFWADGKPSRGILHLNFDLNNVETLALYDASGRMLVDEITVPKTQYSNTSYGLIEKANEQGEKNMVWTYLEKTTPASDNDHSKKVSSGEQFVKYDPTGIGMAVIALSVVFCSLALLYIIFKNIGAIFTRKAKKAKTTGEVVVKETKSDQISGEVSAAIAMALHLYESEIHDDENMVLTIKRISRAYSPWSSKIYTLRKYPQ
ncbi:OadG family transporter subunit [Maribellus sp. YY47]|uniref:OadG family transporter subunit n=1 Tax=Maribellus sp. YY47 TaxID=2929486 RepID=UPI0020014E3E|nr:OadG family transporter subunit [Maribellus sp. YY47]MCK3685151.1 OadG family protein [Maribellus sp. YY47]